jgi:hypothetical protein
LPRALLLILPALALIVWGVGVQLPRWTAPQPDWFAAGTPGVCAAVDSLRLYQGQRSNITGGIGREAAVSAAEQAVAEHYETPALAFSEPLAVLATLPEDDEQQTFYLFTAQLDNATATIYIDADHGDTRALITTPEDETVTCAFDTRAALIEAVRSPPTILLGAYILLTAGALLARRLRQAKGKRP